MVLVLPIASFEPQDYTRAEPGVQGLVDLVQWELWKWDEHGEPSQHPLPRSLSDLGRTGLISPSHPIIPHLLPARTALLENLSMFSENLMETLLRLPSDPSSYLSVTPSDILPHLRAATLRNDILPVLCGSAFRHIGTELVMNYVGELLPSPADVVDAVPTFTAPLRMLAWKVSWDKRKGWMTFVRVYSGKTCNQYMFLVPRLKSNQGNLRVRPLYSMPVVISAKGYPKFSSFTPHKQKKSMHCRLDPLE